MRQMKDSGVEWVGKIPDSWTISRFRYLGTWTSGATPSKAQASYWDGGTNWVSSREVKGDFLTATSFQISDTAVQASNLRKWDPGTLVMVTRSGILQHTIPVALLAVGATINQDVKAFSPSGVATATFVKYFIKGLNDLLLTLSTKGKTTVDSLDSQLLNDVPVPLPPIFEQQRIADFLGAKTAEIDSLRSRLERQIEVLESYKRSVITEAVTRGLDSSVPMKDSEIPWISKIPTHWDVRPVYFLFYERKTPNVFGLERNLLSLSYGKIIRKDINNRSGLLPANFNGYNVIQPNDIVLRFTDLQNDKRSLRTGLSNERGIITSAYVTISSRPGQFAPYHHYLLHAYDAMKVFYNMGNGVRQSLNFNEFSKAPLLVPPLVEQRRIAAYLDEKVSAVDEIISLKQEQLTKLADYKKSLIFEYVTGKKEVPA